MIDATRGLALEVAERRSRVAVEHPRPGPPHHGPGVSGRRAPVEARESLSEAVRHLEFSLGADHADTRRRRSLLAGLD